MSKKIKKINISQNQDEIHSTGLHNLNDDCLIQIFQYLSVTHKIKLERGIYLNSNYFIIFKFLFVEKSASP